MEGRNNRILEIDSLAIYFGGLKAIDGVSLYIEKNDFLGLIGPNGAGKSTLFNAITGNIVPTMGTIAFNNTCLLYTSDAADEELLLIIQLSTRSGLIKYAIWGSAEPSRIFGCFLK